MASDVRRPLTYTVEDDKLLVFISWSKPLAKEAALGLRDLITVMFDPVVLPWMSDQDIELGSRSMDEVGETLDRSSFGIIVVTRANQNSQWINFEAGALPKKVGHPATSVIPLLLDFERTTELRATRSPCPQRAQNRRVVPPQTPQQRRRQRRVDRDRRSAIPDTG